MVRTFSIGALELYLLSSVALLEAFLSSVILGTQGAARRTGASLLYVSVLLALKATCGLGNVRTK